MSRPRVRVPRKIKKGDTVTIKTLIAHKMETGVRRNKKTGKLIPRKIINSFEARIDGKTVFKAALHPAVSANPYISFTISPEKSGAIEFVWTEDGGKTFTKSAKFTVA